MPDTPIPQRRSAWMSPSLFVMRCVWREEHSVTWCHRPGFSPAPVTGVARTVAAVRAAVAAVRVRGPAGLAAGPQSEDES